MSLLFNILSRLVIAFLPRSKRLLISWLQSPSAVILELPNIKFVTVTIVSLSICHEVMGWDAMILVFWMLSFKPTFSPSSFTFIKRLFSSLLSAIRVVSSVYLRLFRKGRGTRGQIANIHQITEKAREFQKNIYFCFIDYAKAFECVDHNKLWKTLKEMGIPDHLTCLLRNLCAGQEATVRTGHGIILLELINKSGKV